MMKLWGRCGISALSVGMIGAVGMAQGNPPPKVASASQQTAAFICPDKAYQKACDSYEELVRAGDQTLMTVARKGGLALVCFRQPEDDFFVIDLNAPGEGGAATGAFSGFVNGLSQSTNTPELAPIPWTPFERWIRWAGWQRVGDGHDGSSVRSSWPGPSGWCSTKAGRSARWPANST